MTDSVLRSISVTFFLSLSDLPPSPQLSQLQESPIVVYPSPINSRIAATCNVHFTMNHLKTDVYLNYIQNFSSDGTENTIVAHYKNKSSEF